MPIKSILKDRFIILNIIYERGITHPLDKAHQDAVQLIKNKARKILGVK
jgi:hypothetical protein